MLERAVTIVSMTQVAGELEAYGFDEIEPGLVLDTPDNRRRIYQLGDPGTWQFERILDEDGTPTGLIRPMKPEEVTRGRESKHDYYRDLLVDPDDPWSDYKGPDDWPMDNHAPMWVHERVRRWRAQESNGVPEAKRKPFPVRCEVIRVDGTRCWLWASKPDVTPHCAAHLKQAGADPSRIAHMTKLRMTELTPLAADRLEWLATNGETHAVQLKASTEILDRGGVRAGVDIEQRVEIEVSDPAAEVREKLAMLAKNQEKLAALESERLGVQALEQAKVVQGEVVTDDSAGDDGSES